MPLPFELKLETTADGSLTLYVPDLDEHYHSVNGAIQESQQVYIQTGLCHRIDNYSKIYSSFSEPDSMKHYPAIQVLEFGFGTGLNAFLTALEAEKRKINIRYTALEKYPLPQDITDQLNYSEANNDLFQAIHQSVWEQPVPVHSYFTLHKIKTDFSNFDFPDKYDVVYYDAFAPDKQPEVWPQELFDKIFSAMRFGGVLTTYCAKGSIRRMMQSSGFTVERCPGPLGKREILRAHALPNTHPDKEKKEQQQ